MTPVEVVQLSISTVIDAQVLSNFNWQFSSPFVWDHDISTCWSSQSNNNEFVTVNIGEIISVKGLSLAPRMMGYGFPIRPSNNSQNFIHILDQHYSNFTPIVDCTFPNPVDAQYFQVVPITYDEDDHEIKLFQLGEIFVQPD